MIAPPVARKFVVETVPAPNVVNPVTEPPVACRLVVEMLPYTVPPT